MLAHRDLDARLELVIAAPDSVVDLQDGLDVGEQVRLRQEVADDRSDHRSAPEPATDADLVSDRARCIADDADTDIVRAGYGPVDRGTAHRDLELPRQEREFRVIRRPLPEQLGRRSGIGDFVGDRAGEVVGGDVAHAVPRRLDRVHLHVGEGVEDVWHVLELRPVELDVLPRGEVSVTPVPALRDMGQLPHLAAVERSVGDGHAKHVGVQLQVEAVHQP